MKHSEAYTDVSHGLGIPFGGLGTGYFVYGRHGFVNINMDGFPETEQTAAYPHGNYWDYLTETPDEAPFALYIEKNGVRTLLQSRKMRKIAGNACSSFEMHAFVPFGYCKISVDENTDVDLFMYSSAKPHDINQTSIPACVIELTITNHSDETTDYTFGLVQDGTYTQTIDNELLLLNNNRGSIAFGVKGICGDVACLRAEAGSAVKAIAAIGWYFPEFSTYGIADDDIMVRTGLINKDCREINKGPYLRYYTNNFIDASQIVRTALNDYSKWRTNIERWHDSIHAPASYLRLWFGSYASVITASLYTREGYYLEIEQPHGCLSTMDVNVYSTWLFMINWPEIERQELTEYIQTIPAEGNNAGKVWHSLWADNAHYVEESIFVLRIWRFALWSGDKEFLGFAFDSVKRALEYAYNTEGYGYLINNVQGNQSYDAWKMPGIGAYVNIQWIFALFAFNRICKTLGKPTTLCGIELDEFLKHAIAEYNEQLWDEKEGYWHAYRPNEKSNYLPFGDAIFIDQLFGLWAVSIDNESKNVLDPAQVKAALQKIYVHNRMEEKKQGYSVWLNGMLPEREKSFNIHLCDMTSDEKEAQFGAESCACFPDEYNSNGYHALSAWLSPQMVLASLFGYLGMENESTDIFVNLTRGVDRNIVAVGEYNRAIDKDLNLVTSIQEPGKDTPRFPPYPRYKSSWEYLVCLLGLTLDFDTINLKPFKSLEMSVTDLELAGIRFTVKVEKNWTRCLVNGEEAVPTISRKLDYVSMEFVK